MPFAQYIRKPLVFNQLGKPINDLTLEQAMEKAGLNFDVGITETRVRLESLEEPGKYLLYKVPGNFATYRKDTNKVFGPVGSKYEIVQNSVALDFIEQVCNYDKSVRIETAGCYNDGANMLVTAKFPEPFKIGNDDTIDRYLLFTNAHDGSGSIQCAIVNIRVVCNNMLNQALKNCVQSFSFKHTKNVHNSIMKAVEDLRQTYLYSTIMNEQMEHLSKIKINDGDLKNYVYSLFLNNEQLEYARTLSNISRADYEIISVRMQNKIIDVMDTIDKGCGQSLHRGTALWLYNGVNCYYNNTIEYKNAEDKFESLTKKQGFKINQKAYDLILNLAA